MIFRRKKKTEFPKHWKLEDGSAEGFICSSWKDVSYKKFLEIVERPEDTLTVLTGASKEILKDKQFKRKMESMTLWSLEQPKLSGKPEIIIDNKVYLFPDDLNLLEYSTGQYHYIITCMTPLQRIAQELEELQNEDDRDELRIAELLEKQSLEMLKLYPQLIACYIGIATGEDFTGDVNDDLIDKIWTVECAQVLNLGAFFLLNSGRLVSLKRNLVSLQEYQTRSFPTIIKKQVMTTFIILGAYLYLLKAWLIDTVNSLKK